MARHLALRIVNWSVVTQLLAGSLLLTVYVCPIDAYNNDNNDIKLLESPIPAAAPPPPSQKASSDDISGTKRGTIDPLVSKRPEKNSE